MARSPVVGAAFGTFAVWWLVSLAAYLATGKVWSGGLWLASSGSAWLALLAGGAAGVVAMIVYIIVARQWRLAQMQGDNVRGVVCSIGQLPMHINRPAMSPHMPDKHALKMPPREFDPQNKIDRDWMDKWFKTYEADYPEHARLMRAMAQVLNKNSEIPAGTKHRDFKGEPYSPFGYDRHEHGGHTLLEHSWITGSVAIWESRNGFSYTGTKYKREGGENTGWEVIPLNDGDYKFEPFDPLIGLIGFIHSVGKTVTFKKQGDGYIQVDPRSDCKGAAILANMQEFWALDYEDRMIVLLTVGNYRKPSQMPLRREGAKAKALSDRTMAMLQLITKTDDEAGAIEDPSQIAKPKTGTNSEEDAQYLSDLWDRFKDLLNESYRVFHEPHKFRIGQKNQTAAGAIVTLKEDDLRAALLNKMAGKLQDRQDLTAPGSVQITMDLLKILAEKQCLMTEFAGVEVPAAEAVWKVEFLGKDKNKPGEVISNWPYAIIINPDAYFPRLTQDQDAGSSVRVVGPAKMDRMGEPKKPKKTGLVDALLQPALEAPDGTFLLADDPKAKGKGKAGHPQRQQGAAPAQTVSANTNAKPVASSPVDDDTDYGPSVERPSARPAAQPAPTAAVRENGQRRPQEQAPAPAVQSTASIGVDAKPAAEVASTNDGAVAVGPAPMVSTSSFLDDVDPPSPAVKREPEHVPATPELSTPIAQPLEVASGDSVERMAESVRQKLKEAASRGPTVPNARAPAQAAAPAAVPQAQAAPGPEPQGTRQPKVNLAALPGEVIALTRSLADRLEWMDRLRTDRKIAAVLLEDGRFGYGLDALKAHDPNVLTWLQTDVLSQLALAKRIGETAPVCFMRTDDGVSLLVVNRRAVKEIVETV
ncbi:hypothetical protein [Ottowia sp.]|uniref:hypothetical protein n=1 Tax=Ottowia sp. TaxID=1898956 RepID=UPI0025E46B97|nr:hypothetical protein [Ottowia sp.]MBK6616205.1 hypothetical protein [Ottowia sp.]